MQEKTVLAIQPLSNLVLILPDPKEQWLKPEHTKILRPDQANLSIPTGVVLAAGPGLNTTTSVMPMHVSPGDRVVIDSRAAQVIFHEGQECLLVHENDIIGKVVSRTIKVALDAETVTGAFNQVSLN